MICTADEMRFFRCQMGRIDLNNSTNTFVFSVIYLTERYPRKIYLNWGKMKDDKL